MLMAMCICQPAYAETTTQETAATTTTTTTPDVMSRLTYEVQEDGVTITSFAWTNEPTVTIPDTIEGKPVTAIGKEAFLYCYADTVELPDTVRTIGEKAFAGCAYLQTMTIPSACTEIGYAAFADCDRLTTVAIPETVKTIEHDAFRGTPFLAQQSDAFVILGDGILYAYRGTDADVQIPDTVRVINAYAFANHHNIHTVQIPASVTEVRAGAFDNCMALEEIALEGMPTLFEPDAVRNTNWYQHFPSDYVTIGTMLIGYRGEDTVVDIPEGITVINRSAFEGNPAITTVTLPDSVTEIRRAAFYRCTSLQVVKMGDQVTEIGEMAFFGCQALGYIHMSHQLETIGARAFVSCDALDGIIVPDEVTAIGERAIGYRWSNDSSEYVLDTTFAVRTDNAVAKAYAEENGLPLESVPAAETTMPPVTTTSQTGKESPWIGKPTGTYWIPALILGGLLVLGAILGRIVRKHS